jgi:hypothetical protein
MSTFVSHRPTAAPAAAAAVLALSLAVATPVTLAAGPGPVCELSPTSGTVDGAVSGTINGVAVVFDAFVENGTIARFLVLGDLVLEDRDVLRVRGTRLASFVVAGALGIDVFAEATATASARSTAAGSRR